VASTRIFTGWLMLLLPVVLFEGVLEIIVDSCERCLANFAWVMVVLSWLCFEGILCLLVGRNRAAAIMCLVLQWILDVNIVCSWHQCANVGQDGAGL